MIRDAAFFTICARNYLAAATLLGESVRRWHPDASFTIWLLDPGDLPAVAAGFDVRPVERAVPAAELGRLAFYYDILELATAVKPRCFSAHFAEGARRVIYLDPDIVLYRPLRELEVLLDGGAPAVLTPHILAPYPGDRAKPDDLEILQAGLYNLGFLALASGPDADALLDWWWGWLRTACFQDKSRGTFTDQKWMNFTPLFWPRSTVLRDSTYNVAYWNLSQRHLAGTDGAWTVDGRPLAFFHFSGYDPERPGELSKHQTRLSIAVGSPLAAILAEYAGGLFSRGHRELRRTPVPEVVFDNGVRVDRIARHAYREALGQGLRFDDPRRTGIGSLFAWLLRPVHRDLHGADLPLTRYLMTLYALRPDVRQVYPDVYGADRRGFLEWARNRAVTEMDAEPAMLARHLPGEVPAARPAVAAASLTSSLPVVNLVGYLRAALGIGEAARGYVRALDAAGVPLRLVDCTALCSSPMDAAAALDFVGADDADGSINILHVNADQLPLFRDEVGAAFFAGRYNIGIWAWETLEFPAAWSDRFALLDEIWTGSAFMADAIARVSPVPVLTMPHVVEVPDVPGDRRRFGLPEDEFLFLFTFDFHSTPARKNPLGTLEAFRRAFRPDERVRLVLKSINGHSRPDALAALRRRANGLRVTFLDEALDGTDRFRLLRGCDAFVSLHRAEGFGLGLAEAMACGLPVIGTGWSGNLEFMDASNSYPVAYTLEPLAEDDPPYPAGTAWAAPDLDHAAEQMRRVVDRPEEVRVIGERARRRIAERHSPAAIGELVRRRLDWIAATRQGRAARPVANMPPPRLAVAVTPPRSFTYRALRAGFRLALRVVPDRLEPRLHELSGRVRRHL